MASKVRVIAQAIKYRCERNGIALSNMEINVLAMDVEESLKVADTGSIAGWSKALDAIRRDGGLIVTHTEGGDEYTTVKGKPIHAATAKGLIEKHHLEVTGSSLFDGTAPQQYGPAIK